MKPNKSFKKMNQSPMKPNKSFSLKDCKCVGPIESLALKKTLHTSMAREASSSFSSSFALNHVTFDILRRMCTHDFIQLIKFYHTRDKQIFPWIVTHATFYINNTK